MRKKQKIKIHYVAYILFFIIIAIVILVAVLLSPSKADKFRNNHNLKVATILQSKGEQNQYRQYFYNFLIIEDNKNFEKINFKTLENNIKKDQLTIAFIGGYFDQNYALGLGPVISELKKHKICKSEKPFISKISVIELSNTEEVKKNYNFFEKYDFDEYDYDLDKKAKYPVISAFKNGKKLNIEFKTDSYEYPDMAYATLKFLNEIYKELNKK